MLKIVIAGPNQNLKPLFRTRDGQIFKTYPDLELHAWGKMMRDEVAGVVGDMGMGD